MRLPRHAEIWLPGYVRSRTKNWIAQVTGGPHRVWLAIGDHYEPFWCNSDESIAEDRVALWSRRWPQIAGRHQDSAGRSPKYTFFYPEEEYRPRLIEALAEMTRVGIGDVEIHIHHDREGEQNFVERMGGFRNRLFHAHGLLRKRDNAIRFGFIHGNWALNNSLPGGKYCGLDNELTVLKELGCYADFSMPSGNHATTSRIVNQIYWAIDEPPRPKAYDDGVPVTVGGRAENGLMMIPGPWGIRWRERLIPRIERGELAGYDLAGRYRVNRWLDFAPRIGNDIFVKLFTHGCQDRNSGPLLTSGLDTLFENVRAECERRHWAFYFVSCWEMYEAIEAIRTKKDPLSAVACSHQATAH